MINRNKPVFNIIEEEEKEHLKIPGWEQVEKYLQEETTSGLLVALIEADKLLNATLKKQGYPGKSLDDRIKSAREKFNNLNGLLEARHLLKQFLSNLNANITSLDVEEAVTAYKQSLLDLQSEQKARLGVFERTIILLDYYLPSKWKFVRKVVLLVLLISLIIWLLANTRWGQLIVLTVVGVVNFIYTWIAAIILFCLTLIMIIIASLIYFERRKRRSYLP